MSAALKWKCKTCGNRFTVRDTHQGLVVKHIRDCARQGCGSKDFIPAIEQRMLDGVPTLCKTAKVIRMEQKQKALPAPIPENGVEKVGIWSQKVVLHGTLHWKRK